MNTYAYIVLRASEAVGLKDFNSDAMEGDDFRKVFLALQDAIRSLNSDPSVTFGVHTVVKYLAGSVLTFKPYTKVELAEIAAGGTVDTTDRIVDPRPTIAPSVYRDGGRLQVMDPLDMPQCSDGYSCAWAPDWDQDQLLFGDTVGADVTVSYRKPVPVPSSPTEEIKVPERFHEYLILTLAVGLATKLGATETLQQLLRSLAAESRRVTANNNYSRPVYLTPDLDRFVG